MFVLHCHQPPGNLPDVFDEAYQRCYLPLLETIGRFEAVKVCLHVSGALLEHAVHHQPNFIHQLANLVGRGQVELLGGGFYEPVLSALPDADAQGQLEMMSLLLKKHFGARPNGAWLTERVWEPELPRLLAPAGLGFTFVDDLHIRAGLPDHASADGYWITNRAGQLLAVFGVHRGLRYRIPGEAPETVVYDIANMPGSDVVTFADDGEKFGLWPGSHEWVYGEGWLERFFGALVQAQTEHKVQTVLPSAHLEQVAPRGRVHIPSGTYDELSRWALGPNAAARLARIERVVGADEADRAHLRGGSWADFLIRYPEAGRLQGRMLSVSSRLQTVLEDTMSEYRGRPLPSALQDRLGTVQRDLYRAQAADAYWRGLFAGLHLPFLRADAHGALIRADALLDRVQQGDEDWVGFDEEDLDLDGELEVLLTNRALAAHIRPQEGGCLLGLEDKVRALSLGDVLARRPEPEHSDAQANLLDGYDEGPRWSFIDRFTVPGDESKADVGDFARARYSVATIDVEEEGVIAAYAQLGRRGTVNGRNIDLDKRYSLDLEGAHLSVAYELKNLGDEGLDINFGPQLSLALGQDARIRLDEQDSWQGLEDMFAVSGQFTLEDSQARLRLNFDLSVGATLRAHKVFTTVKSLSGFERIFQGWGLELEFGLSLAPEDPQRIIIGVDVSEARQ